ncbi:putative transporter [Cladophialophora carrionii]|uniref:Putative transporter n=1 Tax=Cladophialophora carrionii TaxID=86049 RepID=A0A1C1C7R9_9EURO|nr:putative transporter [Cladophialophora carrionii]
MMAPGPYPGADVIEPASPHATETTTLLPKSDVGKPRDVPYRDVISGPRFHFLFWSIIFGCTIAFFDTTLMASSHPVITSYFNASNAASWLSTVFYLTSTVFQPVFGRVSDNIGRRPVLIFVIVMFFTSTAWCGAAGDIGGFIAARAASGIGAGGVVSLASILTSDMVKIEYRGIYQSYYNLAYGVGNGLGAALGGFLCDKLGWRAAFYVQLPFIAVYGVLAVLSCPDNLGPNLAKTQGKTIREGFKSFDVYGTVGMILTVSGLILGVNLGGNVFSWTHPFVISSLVVAVIAGIGLVLVERRAERPILPLRLFTTTPVANVIGSNFVASMTVNAVLFNVPLYLQAVRQTSPTTSGFYLFPPLVGASITAIAVGFYITLTRRLKPPMIVGSISALGGAVAVTCLSADTPARLVPWLIPFVSIGQGAFFPAATIAVLALNSQEDQAVATTTLGLVRSLGSILGVALSSWVLQNALPIYLNKYVTAADPTAKEHIIRTVRESIQSIRHLDPVHKKQVITAYASSLRATFIVAIVFATISALLILPAHLPRLQRQEDMDDPEDGVYLPGDESNNETTFSVEDSDEDDDEEQALRVTPSRTITRTITGGTGHSGTRTLSRHSTSFGEPIERRASFDTSF